MAETLNRVEGNKKRDENNAIVSEKRNAKNILKNLRREIRANLNVDHLTNDTNISKLLSCFQTSRREIFETFHRSNDSSTISLLSYPYKSKPCPIIRSNRREESGGKAGRGEEKQGRNNRGKVEKRGRKSPGEDIPKIRNVSSAK